jgi:hypothetical protein
LIKSEVVSRLLGNMVYTKDQTSCIIDEYVRWIKQRRNL